MQKPKKTNPKKYRLPKKRKAVVPDPTPEEIEQRCAEVRATWDEPTRILRIADPALLPPSYEWYPPIIATADISRDFLPELDEVDDMIDSYVAEDDDFEEFLEEVILKEKK